VSFGRTHRVKRVLAGASAAALASMALLPSTGHAEPSINQVEQRLDTLYHEAEAAQERLNELNHQMDQKKERLHALKSDLRKQRRQFGQVSDQVAGVVAEDAQSVESQLSAAQQLVLSDDAGEFQSKLAAQEALSSHKGEMLGELNTVATNLRLREQQVNKELTEVAAAQKQAAKEESTVDAKVADAEDMLSELEADRRAALRRAQASEASRSVQRVAAAPVSGSAATAVDFAMDQIGDSYVYGAAGPDSWDCSGLTMGAWGAAGVSLPHSSSGQMSYGTPVSQSELEPGDLVFYYDPVSHVGMYIGNGQIVHASNPDSPVGTDPVNSMPYSGAVRPG
jgi:peptidoglycan DL-endopeptidase CwlO